MATQVHKRAQCLPPLLFNQTSKTVRTVWDSQTSDLCQVFTDNFWHDGTESEQNANVSKLICNGILTEIPILYWIQAVNFDKSMVHKYFSPVEDNFIKFNIVTCFGLPDQGWPTRNRIEGPTFRKDSPEDRTYTCIYRNGGCGVLNYTMTPYFTNNICFYVFLLRYKMQAKHYFTGTVYTFHMEIIVSLLVLVIISALHLLVWMHICNAFHLFFGPCTSMPADGVIDRNM